MKNVRKRKYILHDTSFFKHEKALKQLKVDRLAYENKSLINWNEVKIILDATVVEKYLNNYKKSESEVLTANPINNTQTFHHERKLVSDIPQTNRTINNAFFEKNDIIVKLEPEDIGVDDLSPNESYVCVSVKKEDYTLATNTDDLDNDDKKFTELLHEDFECQDENQETSLALQVVETALKNEAPESYRNYEEVTIGQEFKQEELIPSYESTELINHVTSTETTVDKSTRSSRKRKKCLDCDDCGHQMVKKSHISSRVNNKNTLKVSVKDLINKKIKGSNCSSRRRTLPKTSTLKALTKFQPRRSVIKVYNCEHCDYKVTRKSNLSNHLKNTHSLLYPNHQVSCSNCKNNFSSVKELKNHKTCCASRYPFRCRFCLVSVSSQGVMRKHLRKMHPDIANATSYQEAINSMKDIMTDLELTNFGQRVIQIRKYFFERENKCIKLYCTECGINHDKVKGKSMKYCHSCGTRLLYQCQKCKMIRYNYIGLWKHLLREDSRCNVSKNLHLIDSEEPSSIINKADTSNEFEQKYFNCEVCDFKGTTRKQLHEHVLTVHADNGAFKNGYFSCSKCGSEFRVGSMRLKRHKEFCGLSNRYPCRFCPITYSSSASLRVHLSFKHVCELDGLDTEEFLDEIITFRKMVRDINNAKFKEKLKNKEVKDQNINQSSYYHDGIKSMLKPVCLRCKINSFHILNNCKRCNATLNFLCLQCDEIFSQYSTAWEHATRTCENRCFTLTMNKTGTDRIGLYAPKLFYCDHCTFKNVSKSVLCKHIEHMHEKSKERNHHITCIRCCKSFYNLNTFDNHKQKCREKYLYICHFCPMSAIESHTIKKHIMKKHAYLIRCEDTIDQIMQQVMNNKTDEKTVEKITTSGQLVKRTFSGGVKIVRFHCSKCKKFIGQKIGRRKLTKQCPNCHNALRLQCRYCGKFYFTLHSLENHLQKKVCEIMERNEQHSIVNYELYMDDHTYARSPPPAEISEETQVNDGETF